MHYEKNTTAQAIIAESNRIMLDEGMVKKIYLDTEGYPTFGFGTLITEDMEEYGKPVGTKVSESRCLQAFFEELTKKTVDDPVAVFGSHWDGMPFEAKKIFINMLYNLGRSRFLGFKKMIAAAKAHNWPLAAAEAKNSKWYRQVKTRGERIVARLNSI